MRDLLLVLGLVAAWVVLSRWVLPWLGVPTCMSGCCQTPYCVPETEDGGASRQEPAGAVTEASESSAEATEKNPSLLGSGGPQSPSSAR